MPNQLYIPLNTIISLDDLPTELNFLEQGIDTIFQNLYFRELVINEDLSGQNVSYYLVIATDFEIAFSVPGAGFKVKLFPPVAGSGVSEFPINIYFHKGILKYAHDFNLSSFSFQGDAFYQLAKKIIPADDSHLIAAAIHSFVTVQNGQVEQFVTDANAALSYNIPYNVVLSESENVTIIVDYLRNTEFTTLWEVIIGTYITGTSQDLIDKTNKFLRTLLTGDYNTPVYGLTPIDLIKNLLIPRLKATLELTAAIEFPRSVLQPVNSSDDVEPDETILFNLLFGIGEFKYSSTGGFGFTEEIAVQFPLDYPKAEIAKTGLLIFFDSAKLDLSLTKNITEATADGRPNDFIGVYIQNAAIYLPKKWFKTQTAPTLKSTNLLIGTGGISGTIGIDGNSALTQTIGNFTVSLDHFDLTFHQNAVIESNIAGTLTMPPLLVGCAVGPTSPVLVAIKGHLGANGDFFMAADSSGGIIKCCIPNILELTINGFELGNVDDRFYVEVEGYIDFTYEVAGFGDFLPKGVEVKRLRIWDDGALEFVGGVNLMPVTVKMDFGPVHITVADIDLGSYERNGRKYAYFGFNGGINIDPGGIDVRGEGVKLYFTIDGGGFDAFVRLDGLGVDIVIPMGVDPSQATALINGYIAMREPPPNSTSAAASEFSGSVGFVLPKLPLSGSAAMRLNPSVPAYLVDLSIDLPNAIPLGSTGLGIYGFRGLVGHHYPLSKKAAGVSQEATWWEYYKHHTPFPNKEGVYEQKMEQGNGLTIGAGVSLATSPDKGKAFSSKLFLLLGLPDTFMLMGQAAILRNRVGLDTTSDPPFSALLVISKKGIEANLGVNYKIPEPSGDILRLNGLFELGFFYGNATAWYINIGRDLPEEKRIQGKLFTLFKLYAYLMLSSSGIRAGAGASWKFKKRYGPVKLELRAYADSAGRISFDPKQIGGYVALGGSIKIKVFGFKFGFSLDISLSGEAPQPFIVSGYIKLTINLPKPFKDIKLKASLTWTFNGSLQSSPERLLDTGGNVPAKAINMMSFETLPIFFSNSINLSSNPAANLVDDYIVPMDTYIDIELLRGVFAESAVLERVGGMASQGQSVMYVSPQTAKSPQIRHEFKLTRINIYHHNGTNWSQIYNVYDAAALSLGQITNVNNVNKKLIGYWQKERADRYNKIRVLAMSPWNYLTQSPGTVLEELGVTQTDIFCNHDAIGVTCINFDCVQNDIPEVLLPYFDPQKACWKILKPQTMKQISGVCFYLTGPNNAVVYNVAGWNFNNALVIPSGDELTLIFPVPCGLINLKLSTWTNTVDVVFYKLEDTGQTDIYGLPIYADAVVQSGTYDSAQLASEVTFNLADYPGEEPVYKAVIIPSDCEEGGNGVTCTNPGETPERLLQFFTQLVQQGLLTSDFLIFPDYDGAFNGIFHNSPLYPFPLVAGTDQINYTVITNTNNTLVILITDNHGFSCEITLNKDPGIPVAWDNLGSINNFQVVSNGTVGENYAFTMEVTYGEFTFTITGTSCYPLTTCISNCSAMLYEACYQSYDDFQFNLDWENHPPDPALNGQSLLDGLQNSIQPIWRPDTRYAIEIKGKDTVSFTGSNNANDQTYVIGFRTAGPVGHYHIYNDYYDSLAEKQADYPEPSYEDLSSDNLEGSYKLSTLKLYIDQLHSYPDAEGNIIMAKPLYYKNANLLLFFKHPFVYTMFNDWDDYQNLKKVEIKLDALIKDPAEVIAGGGGSPTVAPSVAPEWGATNTNYYQGTDVTVLNNFIAFGVPCVALTTTTPFIPISTHVSFPIPDTMLSPQKLYTAIFNSKIKRFGETEYRSREVHNYVFQTSKYESFEKHIHSYLTDDGNGGNIEAVFTIERDFTATGQLTAATDVINDVLAIGDALVLQFNEKFDRVIDGVLKLTELDTQGVLPPMAMIAALNIEFVKIKDSTTGNVIGLLIRSPEPFNDPRMPIANFNETIVPSYATLPGEIFKIIFSKDRANVLITNDSLNLPKAVLNLAFSYLLWNGTEYETIETIDDINIDLNI